GRSPEGQPARRLRRRAGHHSRLRQPSAAYRPGILRLARRPPGSKVTLTDAGPLVALIDADEVDHETCAQALNRVRLPLITTWPAFTEAMYLLTRAGGTSGQQALWKLVLSGRLELPTCRGRRLNAAPC